MKYCGTHYGYNRHRKSGERPCGECRRAEAAYKREWRRVRRLFGLSV